MKWRIYIALVITNQFLFDRLMSQLLIIIIELYKYTGELKAERSYLDESQARKKHLQENSTSFSYLAWHLKRQTLSKPPMKGYGSLKCSDFFSIIRYWPTTKVEKKFFFGIILFGSTVQSKLIFSCWSENKETFDFIWHPRSTKQYLWRDHFQWRTSSRLDLIWKVVQVILGTVGHWHDKSQAKYLPSNEKVLMMMTSNQIIDSRWALIPALRWTHRSEPHLFLRVRVHLNPTPLT